MESRAVFFFLAPGSSGFLLLQQLHHGSGAAHLLAWSKGRHLRCCRDFGQVFDMARAVQGRADGLGVCRFFLVKFCCAKKTRGNRWDSWDGWVCHIGTYWKHIIWSWCEGQVLCKAPLRFDQENITSKGRTSAHFSLSNWSFFDVSRGMIHTIYTHVTSYTRKTSISFFDIVRLMCFVSPQLCTHMIYILDGFPSKVVFFDVANPSSVGVFNKGSPGIISHLGTPGNGKEVLSGVKWPKWQGDFRVLAQSEDGHPLLYLHLDFFDFSMPQKS